MTVYMTQEVQGTQQAYPMPCTVVMPNDQSVIKGAIWGTLAFKFGTSAITAAACTLATTPLIITPALAVPLVCAIGTYALASITGNCIDNASYHLGSRNIVVLQAR